MSEWDKLWESKNIKMLLQDSQWFKHVKAEGDKLHQENQKLHYIENVLREINNSDLGINITIDTGLWKCDKCGVEFDSYMYRWYVPMDYGCLTSYKEDKQKLDEIFGNPIIYPCCYGEDFEDCEIKHICKFKPECEKEVLGE